ncbi:MAG: hypothetical protein COB69_03925 [Phycisphaera sp.]|nr:MAG: hypothetical protein COB69_03925 [Phycisphaera sp.]
MSVDHGANLQSLIKRLAGEGSPVAQERTQRFHCGPNEPMTDPICDELIWSFLVWEAGEKRAAALAAKLCESFVDLNEFRICLTSELVSFFGQTYPKNAERADRMRTSLNDIFRREHEVSLRSLAGLNKREAKAYLDSIEGIPPYVANRTFLLGLGGHAFPLDNRLLKLLAAEEAIAETETVASGAGWLERQIRSGDAAPAFVSLETWAAEQPTSRSKNKKTSKKITNKSDSAGSQSI